MLMGLLALTVAAIFTGAAFYVNVAEHPARLNLDDTALLTQWKPSYKHGAAMQASLAIAGCIFGLIAWWQTRHIGFLAGAILIAAPWPWTLIGIMPTNKTLLATDPANPTAQTRSLMIKWGTLHAVRTTLGALAAAAFFWACLSR